ncbi:ABC transporter permease [Limosilactobacillus walteri]|uniref:ABC transporter permease n=1 Tax=Limosilactobacillus walteri TaxID=2268022 RepID=A0ABR8P680_9LACO|nr:ABC transporter permease [Limosilactobacillus walteri]MBD5806240.1 ABC transporter permease [Limosilactobacillus walteri]
MEKIFLSIKLQLREPISIFFTLVFPLVMMCVMVLSYKNFSLGTDGYHFIDKYVLISVGIGLIPLTVISFPISFATKMKNNLYMRLKYFGVNIITYTFADIVSYVVLSLTSILLNICVAKIFFNANVPNFLYLLFYIMQCEYCTITFLVFGAMMSLIITNPRVILPMGMTLLFTFYLLSGVFIQYTELPLKIRKIGKYIPWKYLMNNFYNIWTEKDLIVTQFIQINTLWLIILIIIVIILYKEKM